MVLNSVALSGRSAIVTGGGRGIGRAVALGLAREGADIALCSRTAVDLEAVATEIRAMGRRAFPVVVDVSQRGQVEASVAGALEFLGRLDILVNCAGISPVYSRAENLAEEDWDRIIDVNLKGTFLCCQAAGRVMIEQRRGKIINVLSIGAKIALPRLAAYCASKGGGEMLTKVLAVEWARHNIQVNAVAPGYVATEFTAGLRANPKIYERLMARAVVDRMAEPEDVVGAAVFLASDSANYVSGATLVIDAGWTAW